MSRTIPVRDGGCVRIGYVFHNGAAWEAYDDRHGKAAVTIHDSREDAERAVRRRVMSASPPSATVREVVCERLIDLADLVGQAVRQRDPCGLTLERAREIFDQSALLLAAAEDAA